VNGHDDRSPSELQGDALSLPGAATERDAARLLSDWLAELGYLGPSDAARIVGDAFDGAFLRTTEHGVPVVSTGVLEELRGLVREPEWTRYFRAWK
jgi:hypothetical protein